MKMRGMSQNSRYLIGAQLPMMFHPRPGEWLCMDACQILAGGSAPWRCPCFQKRMPGSFLIAVDSLLPRHGIRPQVGEAGSARFRYVHVLPVGCPMAGHF